MTNALPTPFLLFGNPSQGITADLMTHLFLDLAKRLPTRRWVLIEYFDSLFLFFVIELWLATAPGDSFDGACFFPTVKPFGNRIPVAVENFGDLVNRELTPTQKDGVSAHTRVMRSLSLEGCFQPFSFFSRQR